MKRIAYRFFLIVLLSVLAVEVFPVSAQEGSWFDEGNYDEEWLDKNFDNDVMIISTPEEFAAFGEYMTRSLWNYPNKTVRLAADMDMSAHTWETPSIKNYFRGVFDGDGHKISGLTIVPHVGGGGYSDDYFYVLSGLFGSVRGTSEIRNLELDETCRIACAKEYDFFFGDLEFQIGTIAASAIGDVRFSHCVNRADVVFTPWLQKTDSHEMVCSVSGLVAHADGATIDHCSNDGEIIVDIGEHSDLTDVWVSGLVGRSRSVYEKGGSLISSVNEGNISVSNAKGDIFVGGLSSNYTFRIDSCENHSVVKVNAHEGSAYVGGVSSASMGITYCFNRDSVICESDGFEVQVGGVCSYSSYNSSQTDSLYACGNEGEIEVKSNGSMLSVGGVMGQNTDCPVVDCWNRGGLIIESSAPRSSSSWNAIENGIAYSTAEMQSAGSGFLDALNNAVKGDAVCRNWEYFPGENDGYPVHIDRIVDGVDSPADHSVGRVYAANGRLFVQSDRSMQLPVYKVTGQIVKIMNVVEGLNTDYLPCGVYVVAGQVVAVTAGNK